MSASNQKTLTGLSPLYRHFLCRLEANADPQVLRLLRRVCLDKSPFLDNCGFWIVGFGLVGKCTGQSVVLCRSFIDFFRSFQTRS
jgi:hypothetical protein